MKVILLQDVRKVGRKFEIKDVADGYALNFLIPRKLAEVSNSSNTRRVEHIKAKDETNKKVQEEHVLKNLKALDGAKIEIKENTNEKGHLFKGVNKEEIAHALKVQGHSDITPEYIMLEKPIKEAGEYSIEVKVQETAANFKLVISAK
ncbi:50S ribosomal protein L9 [Candidatus Parcubacteria bacterium]|nr:50S ribosomal protein L9 [Candidatus Parcubacteria bacterium]